MKFTNITVTGIDDEVDLRWVEAMATSCHPWLEFGVLLSQKRKGSPRYPSPNWLCEFIEHFSDSDSVGLFSAHLCGTMSDRITDSHKSLFTRGDYFGGPPLSAVFDRVQLNGFPESEQSVSEINMFASTLRDRADVILPVPDTKTFDRVRASFMENVHFLHDRSRGRGIAPKTWPTELAGRAVEGQLPFIGFAGGIAVENVVPVLDELCARPDPRPFWIDLETGARTDDRFDMDKVERILHLVEGYVNADSG